MGEAAAPTTVREEFDQQPISVATPSNRVFVTLVGTHDVRVGFAEGFYAATSDREMAAELTRAARLTFVARTRAFYAALGSAAGHRVEPGRRSLDRQSQAYHDGLERLVAEGTAADGRLRMVGVGLSSFTVTVAPGTVAALSESEFAEACRAGTLDFLADHLRRIAELKFDVYLRPGLEAAGVL